jgi:hypothetical protein
VHVSFTTKTDVLVEKEASNLLEGGYKLCDQYEAVLSVVRRVFKIITAGKCLYNSIHTYGSRYISCLPVHSFPYVKLWVLIRTEAKT